VFEGTAALTRETESNVIKNRRMNEDAMNDERRASAVMKN
jgi:hypothetical protein